MKGSDAPIIECEVTFLSREDGGRSLPFGKGILSSRKYMPHLVVGNPQQRMPIVNEKNYIQEDYLGVVFVAGPDRFEFDSPIMVKLALLYYPSVNYDKLISGATFTIREGSRIIGYGKVVRRNPST